jgi:LPXTG-motif cell wall-anchored protein
MDGMTWIGLFGLSVVILGGIAASLFAKRNDEMQSGGH